jgi:hypothetical protein
LYDAAQCPVGTSHFVGPHVCPGHSVASVSQKSLHSALPWIERSFPESFPASGGGAASGVDVDVLVGAGLGSLGCVVDVVVGLGAGAGIGSGSTVAEHAITVPASASEKQTKTFRRDAPARR